VKGIISFNEHQNVEAEDDDRFRSLATTFPDTVGDNAQSQALIADDLAWELPYALAIGPPCRFAEAACASAPRQ
jgi:hypothetical protein